MKGILGKKIGCSSFFTESETIPVTLIQAGPCYVTQIKTVEKDDYNAIQIGFEETRKIKKPQKGHLEKVGKNLKYFAEIKVDDPNQYKIGDQIDVSIFKEGDLIDVTGTSKGRGFAGRIKRWGQKRGPKTHGSKHYRDVGSTGSRFPQKTNKGRRMPGHYGNETVTVRNLQIVKVDSNLNMIAIKGAIPGARGGLVFVKESKK